MNNRKDVTKKTITKEIILSLKFKIRLNRI